MQDNAGAGASSDTTGLLKALCAGGADQALLGVLCDPETAALAHAAGEGQVIEAELGGKSGLRGDSPFSARFRVEGLSDGRIAYTGEMYGGGLAEIGPSCLLSLADADGQISVVVSSERTQCLDRAFFTHFGVEPLDMRIVCVKSTLHFRADFETGSSAVWNVAAPGWFPCALETVDFQNLRPGVRKVPTG